MKILVVEDEPTVAKTLSALLSRFNYAVDVAADGEAGLEMAEAFEYDLVVMDVVLPKLDGISLCQQLRNQGFQSPILLLTGRGGGSQKAIALNAGADDYVVKPFDAEELMARIQALLRRGDLNSQPILTWGTLSIDPSRRQVTYATYLLSLTPKEYAILELLLRNTQRVLSAGAILEHAWNSAESPGEEAVRVHIKELRHKLNAMGAPKNLIKTVYGTGYQMNPLYSSELASQAEASLTPAQITELKAANESLRTTLEGLQVAEKELRQQNEDLEITRHAIEFKLSEILSNALTAISSFRVFANGHWEYEYWSAGCVQLFGYTESELIADTQFWLSRVLPDDREAIVMPLFNHFFAERNVMVEYRFRCKDDSIRWFSTAYSSRKITADCWLVTAVNSDITTRKQAEDALQKQLARAHLIAEMTQTIRQTLDLERILQLTVDEVRQALQTDRVIIFRFQPNWEGIVVAESVAPGQLQFLNTKMHDDCFTDHYIEPYRQGRISTIDNLETSGITPCYAEFLTCFQIKANVIVPILQNHSTTEDCLWGLLIAHQCTHPRQWEPEETELLQQLSNQVGIAIQQAELYQQTHRELLERQRTEAELRDSETRYRLLFENNPTPMWIYDLETLAFLTVNQAAIKHYGYTREELLGMTIANIRPAEDIDRLQKHIATLTLGENDFGVWKHLKRDGSLIDVEILAYTFIYEGRQATLALINDITERCKAEQRIREQAALLDIASDAIFVRDLEHRILYWYQGAERLYGLQAADAIGQNAMECLDENPAQIATIMQTLLKEKTWQGEMRKVTKTGKTVTVESRWTLVCDDTGQPTSILTVSSDVTQKKQLEAQFYHTQRLESLGTLAGGIAHDLNNVLTPILAIAQLMRWKPLTLDTESQELLKVLEDSAKRGANMVKQILTFTRGTDGDRNPMEVAPVLQEVTIVARQTFPKAIQIYQHIVDPPLRLIAADPTHLHQVLLNLCVNARDAMPHGGVLTISAQNYTVDELFAQMHLDARAGNYVLITISDTGIGIPPEVCDRMFDPFFTTKELGQGTGLGLSTVLGIVQSYDGFLRVSSEVGKGAQFKVYLPVTEGLATENLTATVLPRGHGELILIVDDDFAVQSANQVLLEEHDYKTLVANDGIDAIAVYARHQDNIKVVLLDVMMPNMSGTTAIQTLKRMNSMVKIIAISGLPSNRDVVLQAGADVFLAKPYTIESLLRAVDILIKVE